MRTLLRIAAGLLVLLVLVGALAYADGRSMPVNHTVSAEGTVQAPPAKVFHIITDVGDGARWRHEVKSVKVLPQDEGRDHWIEDLGHGMTMDFVAVRTEPVGPEGNGLRAVLLKDPSYGGTWTYEVTPGASANETHLHITEDGYINPPIYRFMMAHVFGPTKNLDEYMREIQAEAKR